MSGDGMRNGTKAVVALAAAAALAGCGGSGATSTTPLPIAGPWTAGQQGDFVGGCEADALTPGLKGNAPDAYCVCALRYAMGIDPDPSVLGAGVAGMSAEANLGNVASEHPEDVSGCGKLR